MKVLVHWQRLDRIDRAGKVCDVWVTYLDWDFPVPRIGEFLAYPGFDGVDDFDDDQDEPDWMVTALQWQFCDPTDSYDLIIACTLDGVDDQLDEYTMRRMGGSAASVMSAYFMCNYPRGDATRN